jgi:hypothetical protein
VKVKFHRQEQWDLYEPTETIIACHLKSSDGNRSTRLFAIVRDRNGVFIADFGGKLVRDFFANEIAYVRNWAGIGETGGE